MFMIGENFSNRLLKLKTNKQLHCLANRDILNDLNQKSLKDISWGNYFNILFKPTFLLRSMLNEYQNILG